MKPKKLHEGSGFHLCEYYGTQEINVLLPRMIRLVWEGRKCRCFQVGSTGQVAHGARHLLGAMAGAGDNTNHTHTHSLCPFGDPGTTRCVSASPPSGSTSLPKGNLFNKGAGRLTLPTHPDRLCGRNHVKSLFVGLAVGALRSLNQI